MWSTRQATTRDVATLPPVRRPSDGRPGADDRRRRAQPTAGSAGRGPTRRRGQVIVLHLEGPDTARRALERTLVAGLRAAGSRVVRVAPRASDPIPATAASGSVSPTLDLRGRLEATLLAAVDRRRGRGRGEGLVVLACGVSAAAALQAAAARPEAFRALLLVDGRVDLAEHALQRVRTPTLMLVASNHQPLVDFNRTAASAMQEPARLVVLRPTGGSTAAVGWGAAVLCREWLDAGARVAGGYAR